MIHGALTMRNTLQPMQLMRAIDDAEHMPVVEGFSYLRVSDTPAIGVSASAWCRCGQAGRYDSPARRTPHAGPRPLTPGRGPPPS